MKRALFEHGAYPERGKDVDREPWIVTLKNLLSFIAGLMFCTGPLPQANAWQLQELSLEERIRRSELIVYGTIKKTIKEQESLIDGVGLCRTALLKVEEVLKGGPAPFILVEWCAAAEAEAVTSPLNGEHIWFLKPAPEHTVHLLAGNFAAILFREELDKVKNLLLQTED